MTFMSVSGNCVFAVFLSLTVCYNRSRHWGVAARTSGVCVNTLGLWPWRRQPGWFGETFGIGFLHPGWAEGAVPRYIPARPRCHSRGSLLRVGHGRRTTLVAFFLAEIGDKTQIATVALAARFEQFSAVVIGTTGGMMLANIPVVLVGHRFADRLPVRVIRVAAAVVFAALAVLTLVGTGG